MALGPTADWKVEIIIAERLGVLPPGWMVVASVEDLYRHCRGVAVGHHHGGVAGDVTVRSPETTHQSQRTIALDRSWVGLRARS